MLAIDEEKRAQVEKIVQSPVFRSSESLRRLLKFLSDRTLAGEAENLKEYSVGIDAFGKPPEYDPRHDSAVRIQVGRLRQKLSEYYLTEGKDDPVIVDLPKGGFKIHFEDRPSAPEPPAAESLPPEVAEKPLPARRSRIVPVLGVALALSLGWATWATISLRAERTFAATIHASWTPQLEQLWAPIIGSPRPLVLAVSSPLFVGIKGYAYYRDVTLNRWEDVEKNNNLKNVRRVLGNPEIFIHRSYTGTGDANAMLLLGKLLGTRKQNLSFTKSSDLSWQQFADNNVILIGTPRSFSELLKGLPADYAMSLETDGLHVLHTGTGEAAFYADQTAQGQRLAGAPEDGEVYALITQAPGPDGKGIVASFSSNLNAGALAAVQWFTDPVLAASAFDLIRDGSGHIPAFYQIGLRVEFKGGVPTQTTSVTHREIHSSSTTGRK